MAKPSRQTLADVLFWLLAAVSGTLLVAVALVVTELIPLDAPPEPATSRELLPQPATSSGLTERPPTTRRRADAAIVPRIAESTLLVMTAARGDSWFSARVGTESGKVLAERVLAQGESVRLRSKRIWLSVGAAGNVEVTVNGRPRALPLGTVSVTLTPARTAAPAS